MPHSNPQTDTVYDRVWWWRKWLGNRKGQRCRIVARGKLNSALVEFEDGTRVVTSRYAVRRDKSGGVVGTRTQTVGRSEITDGRPDGPRPNTD
jgi:hypothetical protein